MAEHTPGPWKAEYDLVEGPDGAYVAKAIIGVPREEYLANARLIAAAPDLLEALENVLDEVRFEGETGVVVVRADKANWALRAAVRAIAKARGQGHG